ncbi:MAG: Dihydropteroate synthase [Actinobacteria bacterium ADurb.Bin444]|nr:MAG: Dihydropteroate synthase [Actinobacteria bacterium ADurb.Bin444]
MIPLAGMPQVIVIHDLSEARRVMEGMAVSPPGVSIMDRKALFRVVRLKGLDVRAANILKQEMLSRGGEVAISRDVYEMRGGEAECLVMGTASQFERLLPKLKEQPFGLRAVGESVAAALAHFDQRHPTCHACLASADRPMVMGVLNVTPDSFSDGGDYFDADAAIARAWEMVEEGADLIDVGAESTRPWSEGVGVEEELSRLLPVLRALGGELPVPISVDTSKAAVASAALDAGARIINDITALRADPEMVAVVRDAGCPVILAHMKGTPGTMQEHPEYDNVVEEVYAFLAERLNWAVDQGVAEANLLVDPGIGFGKSTEHNLALLRQLRGLRCLGRPVVLGASRKAFLGRLLGIEEPKERSVGTLVTTALAALEAVDIVRVHNVRDNVQAVRVVQALFPADQPAAR